jgi:hypothetical protein
VRLPGWPPRQRPGEEPAAADGTPSGSAGLTVESRYDQLPPLPECPVGWRTGPPDFLIIGAQKAGTTWWQGLVEEHPAIVRPGGQRRELHFFDHFWDRWPTAEQFALYERYFPRPEGSLVGEKTPGYLYQPWVAPMLAHAAPGARLIVLMRDPVERYASGLGLLERSGALKGEIGAGEIGVREHRIAEAMERGRYAGQLEWYLRLYPRDRFLLLQYERCVADPQGQLDRTFAFLGLPPHAVSAEEIARERKKSSSRPVVPPEIRALLRDYYAPDIERLRQLAPDLDLSLWPGVGAAGPARLLAAPGQPSAGPAGSSSSGSRGQ